ncbi:unnamed protein product [Brachionus calyciflorus]|uniref:DUF1772 domain-containing protein n=1 Tax=Brachionus calyciflorus TaxID=104777 RepID=A0A814BK44_9BILA|nr:unnamed protein product [Brachionus calyciflorus]
MISSVLLASDFLTKISVSLFTGGAVYISLVEHPARLRAGTKTAIEQFRPSYKRAAKLQASLATLGFIGSTTKYYLNNDIKCLTSGLLILSVIPFTLLIIMPTNKKLLDENLDKNSNEAKLLLQQWGRLHWVRSILSIVSLILIQI